MLYGKRDTAWLRFLSTAFLLGLLFGTGFTILLLYSVSLQVESLSRPYATVHHFTHNQFGALAAHQRGIKTANEVVPTSQIEATTPPFIEDRDDNITASQLHNKVRVLCWIMTSPATLQKKAIYVRDTWSKRCNIRLFMSSVEDQNFPTVGLPVKEGRDQLYEKTKAAYRYVWEHYKDKADWFMKADDDTYVIVENLRFLLKDYDRKTPIYFGRKFNAIIDQGYMSGGAGYVLSKEALKRYINGLDSKKCRKGGGVEDVEIGRCMKEIGAEAGDSRDVEHKESFHPLSPRHHAIPGSLPRDYWLWKYNYYPMCLGANCSSKFTITFHDVHPEDMHIYDYLIYNIQVYGLTHMYRSYSNQ